jgi:hypothetical protein
MKSHFVLPLLGTLISLAVATAQAEVDWKKARSAAGYEQATAHAPQFDNTALWPNVTGAEAYVKQTWSKGHVYIWANPGKSGGVGDGGNWVTEDGQPAGKLTFGLDTDIVLPAAANVYTVDFKPLGAGQLFRHVTIGRNATFSTGGDGKGRTVYGNLWVKHGGASLGNAAMRFAGEGNSFVRNDNIYWREGGIGEKEPEYKAPEFRAAMISQYITNMKAPGASVEYLGHVRVLDEFSVVSGMLIIGPDTLTQPGRNATPKVQKGAVLAIMDGARFFKWINEWKYPDMILGGTIQGGTSERPLKRNAYFGMSFRPWQEQYMAPYKNIKQINETFPVMTVESTGALKTFIAQPEARLVVKWHGVSLTGDINEDGADKLSKQLQAADYARIPRKIDMLFKPGASCEDVTFEDVHVGGMMHVDPATKAAFKNVRFGSNCDQPESSLWRQVKP